VRLRVVLGEDNFLAREAITSVLAGAADVELHAACEDLDSLRAAVDDLQPDVVVTDIRMPPTLTDEGIRFAQELRTSHPETGVVVLSQYADGRLAARLFEGGSAGRAYLLKERVRNRDELVRTIREVEAGGSVVDPVVVEQLVEQRRRVVDSPLSRLTPKELEVLALIAEGKNNTAIADSLVVTKRAVERHINSMFSKLELQESGDVSRRVRAALLYLAA
jgi:DNA-binding NarL/FixJ family response regulator